MWACKNKCKIDHITIISRSVVDVYETAETEDKELNYSRAASHDIGIGSLIKDRLQCPGCGKEQIYWKGD